MLPVIVPKLLAGDSRRRYDGYSYHVFLILTIFTSMEASRWRRAHGGAPLREERIGALDQPRTLGALSSGEEINALHSGPMGLILVLEFADDGMVPSVIHIPPLECERAERGSPIPGRRIRL